jgi:hypothetical protein
VFVLDGAVQVALAFELRRMDEPSMGASVFFAPVLRGLRFRARSQDLLDTNKLTISAISVVDGGVSDEKTRQALALGFSAGVEWCLSAQFDADVAQAALALGVSADEAATGGGRGNSITAQRGSHDTQGHRDRARMLSDSERQLLETPSSGNVGY